MLVTRFVLETREMHTCRAALAQLVALCVAGPLIAMAGEPTTGRLTMLDNQGFGDPSNVGVTRMRACGDHLYLGTWNVKRGGRLYRSADGRAWQPLSEPGFGNPNNFTVQFIVPFAGRMYASTWNNKDGGAIYRANVEVDDPAKIAWETITADGMGDKNNRAFTHLCAFRDHLYAGCFNLATGPEIWRSPSGDPRSWTQVNQDGFGQPANSDATMMVVHGGYLYVGTESARALNRIGCQLVRTEGALAPPYDTWQQVNTDGFGDPRNHNICGLGVLNGRIYAGTWNWTRGLEVWRATLGDAVPFADWEKVASGGFGDRRNIMTATLLVADGALYVGTIGTFNLRGDFFSPTVKVNSAAGGVLMRTTDGRSWHRIDAPGFMTFPQIGIEWLEAFRGKIYIGSQALDHPGQLWIYDPQAP
jgi:flagellin